MTEPIKLPPLPEPPKEKGHQVFAFHQMRVYATAAVEADRANASPQEEWAKKLRYLRDLTYYHVSNGSKKKAQAKVDEFFAHAMQRIAAIEADRKRRGEPVAWQVCEMCQGNGEIVTDWDRYKNPRQGDIGDEAVAECPDCDGTGKVESDVARRIEGEGK